MPDNISKLYGALIQHGYSASELGGDENSFRNLMKDEKNRDDLYRYVSDTHKNDFVIGDRSSYDSRIAESFGGSQKIPMQRLDEPAPAMPPVKQAEPVQQAEEPAAEPEKPANGNVGVVDPKYAGYAGIVSPRYARGDVKSQEEKDEEAKRNEELRKQAKENGQLDYIENRQAQIEQEFREKHPILASMEDVSKAMGSYGTGKLASEGMGLVRRIAGWFNKDIRQSQAELDMLSDTEKILTEAKHNDDNFFSKEIGGFYRGVWAQGSSIRNWDLGLGNMINDVTVRQALDKAYNGEPLTGEEEAMLTSLSVTSAINAAWADQVSKGYNLGEGVGESLGYMEQFAMPGVGGLYNAARGAGMAAMAGKGGMKVLAEKGVANFVLRREGQNELMRFMLNKYGPGATRALISPRVRLGLGRLAGDVAAGAVMTGTYGAFQTAGEINKRLQGDVLPSDLTSKKIEFAGVDRDSEEARERIEGAYYTAPLKVFGEIASENLGDYFDMGGKLLLRNKNARKLLNKIPGAKSTEEFLALTPTGEITRTMEKLTEKVRLSSFAGEVGEELANNVWDASVVGDMNFSMDPDSKDWENSIFNPESNFDLLMSVAAMNGHMFVARKGASMFENRAVRASLSKASEGINNSFGDKSAEIQKNLNEMGGARSAQYIKDLVNDGTIQNTEQLNNVITYSCITNAARGINTRKSIMDGEGLTPAYDAAYNAGFGLSPDGYHQSAVELTNAEKLARAEMGEEGFAALKSAVEGADKASDIGSFLSNYSQNGGTEAGRIAAESYIAKWAREKGVKDWIETQAQTAADQLRTDIAPYVQTDRMTGAKTISMGTYTDPATGVSEQVYIMSQGNGLAVVIRDNGQEMVPESTVTDAVTYDADQYVGMYYQQTLQAQKDFHDYKAAHHAKTVEPAVGLDFTQLDDKGQPKTYRVYAQNEDGTFVVSQTVSNFNKQGQPVVSPVGENVTMTREELLDIQDKMYETDDVAANQEQTVQAQEAAAEQASQPSAESLAATFDDAEKEALSTYQDEINNPNNTEDDILAFIENEIASEYGQEAAAKILQYHESLKQQASQVNDQVEAEEAVNEEPAAPVAEEQATEQPAAEEPVAEQPVAEQPAAEPVNEEPVDPAKLEADIEKSGDVERMASEYVSAFGAVDDAYNAAVKKKADVDKKVESTSGLPQAAFIKSSKFWGNVVDNLKSQMEPEAAVTEETPAVEQSVAEEPVAEQPVTETPAAEPVAEQPVVEQPAAEPVAEQPVVEQPAAEQPVAEEPVAEPVAETPAPEKPKRSRKKKEKKAEEGATEVKMEDNVQRDHIQPDVVLQTEQPAVEQSTAEQPAPQATEVAPDVEEKEKQELMRGELRTGKSYKVGENIFVPVTSSQSADGSGRTLYRGYMFSDSGLPLAVWRYNTDFTGEYESGNLFPVDELNSSLTEERKKEIKAQIIERYKSEPNLSNIGSKASTIRNELKKKGSDMPVALREYFETAASALDEAWTESNKEGRKILSDKISEVSDDRLKREQSFRSEKSRNLKDKVEEDKKTLAEKKAKLEEVKSKDKSKPSKEEALVNSLIEKIRSVVLSKKTESSVSKRISNFENAVQEGVQKDKLKGYLQRMSEYLENLYDEANDVLKNASNLDFVDSWNDLVEYVNLLEEYRDTLSTYADELDSENVDDTVENVISEVISPEETHPLAEAIRVANQFVEFGEEGIVEVNDKLDLEESDSEVLEEYPEQISSLERDITMTESSIAKHEEVLDAVQEELDKRGVEYTKVENTTVEEVTTRFMTSENSASTTETSQDLEKVVQKTAETLGTEVQVVNSAEELDKVSWMSASDKEKMKREGMAIFDERTGNVLVYMPHIRNAEDAVTAVLHEVVGHKNLRNMFGEAEYDACMNDLYERLPEEVQKEIKASAEKDYKGSIAVAMDEYLAEVAGRDSVPSWFDRVVAAFRQLLRTKGYDVKLSENDVRYLLWQSKHNLEKGDILGVADREVMRSKLGINKYEETPSDPRAKTAFAKRNYTAVKSKSKAYPRSTVYWGPKEKSSINLSELTDQIMQVSGPNIVKLLKKYDDGTGNVVNWASVIGGNCYFYSVDGDYSIYVHDYVPDVIDNYERFKKYARNHLDSFSEDIYTLLQENGYSAGTDLDLFMYFTGEGDRQGSQVGVEGNQVEGEAPDNTGGDSTSGVQGTSVSEVEEEPDDDPDGPDGPGGGAPLGPRAQAAVTRFMTSAKRNPSSTGPVSGSIKEQWDKVVNGFEFMLSEVYGDHLKAIEEFQKFLGEKSGKAVRALEDCYNSMLALSSKIFYETQSFDRIYTSKLNKALVSLFDTEIGLSRNGISEIIRRGKLKSSNWDFVTNPVLRAVNDYVQSKHGIERNRDMAVRKSLFDKAKEMFVKQNEYALKKVDEVLAAAEKSGDKAEVKRLTAMRKEMLRLPNKHGLKTEDEIREQLLSDWYRKVEPVRTNESLTWSEQQRQMDQLAIAEGADLAVDYSGLSSIYSTDENWHDAAYAFVEDYEKNHDEKKLKKLWSAIDGITKYSLRRQEEFGLAQRGYYDSQVRRFQYFVPLRGFAVTSAEDIYEYLHNDVRGAGDPVKGMVQRTSEAANSFASMMQVAYQTIDYGNDNAAKVKFYHLVKNHMVGTYDETNKAQKPTEEIAYVTESWLVNTAEEGKEPVWELRDVQLNERMSDEQVNEAVRDFEKEMKELRAQGRAKMQKELPSWVPYRVTNPAGLNEHTVKMKVNGRQVSVVIGANPRVAQAVNGLLKPSRNKGGAKSGWGGNLYDWAKNFKAGVLTSLSVNFSTGNLSRDSFFSNFVAESKFGSEFAKKFRKHQGYYFGALGKWGQMGKLLAMYQTGKLDSEEAINERFTDKKDLQRALWFKSFMENGGATGYTFVQSLSETRKKLETDLTSVSSKASSVKRWVTALFDLVELTTQASELVNRFAAYEAAKDLGWAERDCVKAAKEITLNFNRKGAGYSGMRSVEKGRNLLLREKGLLKEGEAKKLPKEEIEKLKQNVKDAEWYIWKIRAANLLAEFTGMGQKWEIFFNAGVQDKFLLWNIMRQAPKKFATYGIATPMMLSSIMYFVNQIGLPMLYAFVGGDDDDEDYYDLSDYDRTHNICFRIPKFGGHGGGWVKLPIPQGFTPFYTLGDVLTGQYTGKRDCSTVDFAQFACDVVMPLGINLENMNNNKGIIREVFGSTAFSDLADVLTNKDFVGRRVYYEPMRDEEYYGPAYNRAKKGTSPALMWAVKELDKLAGGTPSDPSLIGEWVNPSIFDHMAGGLAGGYYNIPKDFTDIAWKAAHPEEANGYDTGSIVESLGVFKRLYLNGGIDAKDKRVRSQYYVKVNDLVKKVKYLDKELTKREKALEPGDSIGDAALRKERDDFEKSKDYRIYDKIRFDVDEIEKISDLQKKLGDTGVDPDKLELMRKCLDTVRHFEE